MNPEDVKRIGREMREKLGGGELHYPHHVDRLVTGRPGGVRLIYRVIGALSGAVGRPPRPAAPSRRPLDSRDSQSFVALRLLAAAAAAAAAGHSSDRRRAR